MSIFAKSFVPPALVFLAACGIQRGPGLMVAHTPNPTTGKMVETQYSPYYEFEYRTPDKKISCRLVSTLGPERIPPGYHHTGPFASDIPRAYRDGLVEWATEIYFFNKTESTITVKPTDISSGLTKMAFNTELVIPPKAYKISPPMIEISSNYGTECSVAFSFEYLGEKVSVQGKAKRLTIQELKAKYGGKNS